MVLSSCDFFKFFFHHFIFFIIFFKLLAHCPPRMWRGFLNFLAWMSQHRHKTSADVGPSLPHRGEKPCPSDGHVGTFNVGCICPQKVGYCWPTIFSAFSIFEEQKQISSWSEALAVSHKRSNYSSSICLNVWRLGSGSNTSAENFAWVWCMLWSLRTQDKSSWVSIDRVDNWESLLNIYHCFNEVDDIGSEDQWSYL